ncbi:papain fold toxin domain-containing protein [Flavihumibacter sp. CACIAM 22H1]|uniref:papain fold toxin domain-containing protein n=1 Tax=Flavihumibacter sp. CACIAM 22H1 TaxID=1812911 RepID=UPI0025C1354E|nr:papain fold toxin domain-containing protein [Flavihumibacter sp. CACIAM 22H1]
MSKIVKGAGGEVRIFEINIGKNGLIGTPTKQLADNGMHRYVEVSIGNEVRIYDNFHPDGILKNDYIKEIGGIINGRIIEGEELIKSAKLIK